MIKNRDPSISKSVQNILLVFTRCRDRQNGSLSNFIELAFSMVRPEWKDISYQIIRESGRILHTHKEKAQSIRAIRPDRRKKEDSELKRDEAEAAPATSIITAASDKPYIDVSKLPRVSIDYATLKDCINHKMTMC